uniref:Solute carrier family 17 member 9 isoform X2 n=1 Tax=Geotrypetes seraphini TaxID=260995 RepID=A0A6P8SQR5_GEOSA|nr:solute carrier family 17 member 9 isoform X2 [Geotrypetes seraphini]
MSSGPGLFPKTDGCKCGCLLVQVRGPCLDSDVTVGDLPIVLYQGHYAHLRRDHEVGGEKILLLSASAGGLITTITPLVTHMTSVPLLFLTSLRFLMGLVQGVHFPALVSLFSRKVRENERAFICCTVGSGSQIGSLVIGGVGSFLLDWYGWESVFYFAGLCTLFWVYWMHRHLLSEKEHTISLEDLTKSLFHFKQTHIPWKRLFKKASVWAVILAQFSVASTFFTLVCWLPTFFKETFPESKGWVFNVVPWLVAIPASIFSGILSDHLTSLGFQTVSVRKLMQIIGMGASSFFILCLSQTTTFRKAILFVSASIGLQTFNHSGILVNVQDLAPSCAGFLYGVANTGGAILGVILVYLSGYFIDTMGSWTPVFHLVIVVNVVGLCIFLLFAEARRVDIDPTCATRDL